MKKLLILAIASTLTCSTSFAKIWRVNNNVGVSANFTSAQQAHDDVNVLAGDTLYFEHSTNSYGALEMVKGLKLIGAGYFLAQNPSQQYNTNVTYLNDIMLRPTATNSLISVSCGNILDSADNLTISRCKTGAITFVAASNCTVANSHIQGISFQAYFTGSPSCGSYGCTNMAVYNNLCTGTIAQVALAYLPSQYGGCGNDWVAPHSVTAFNNSILGGLRINGFAYNNICAYITTNGSTTVTNNIFYEVQENSKRNVYLPGTNQTVSTVESGNGNQFSIDFASIYTTPNNNGLTADTAWHLNPASAAIGAGTSGVDCGATGGSNPYVFGAQPAIPAIYKLNVAPAPSGNSIGVTISTRSNN